MITDSLERIEGFREKWPFVARYLRVNGWRMHYVDEGIGDPILLLHGNSKGFLYRDVILPLVDAGHRVIVSDMVGFGLSEKPAREGAHSLGWAYREPHRPGPPAGSAPLDGGLPRLGWAHGPRFRDEQSGMRACAGRHEHLGVADAASGISHSRLALSATSQSCHSPDSPSSPGALMLLAYAFDPIPVLATIVRKLFGDLIRSAWRGPTHPVRGPIPRARHRRPGG